jgi:hypothetical protein
MSPDTIQVAGNLSYYWGPNGGLVQGNCPEQMLGHLGCLQWHDLLATLELQALYSITLQY